MLAKLVSILFLFGALLAQSVYGAPSLAVVPSGIVGGNRQWLVSVTPDAALYAFINPPGKTGATMNTELGFTVGAGSLVSAAQNTLDWPTNNTVLNPFTNTATTGVNISGNHVFASIGSAFFTTVFPPKQLLTITTVGSGITTLTWSGAYQGKGRLIENGINYDLFSGSATVPEPASLLMAAICGVGIVGWFSGGLDRTVFRFVRVAAHNGLAGAATMAPRLSTPAPTSALGSSQRSRPQDDTDA